MYMARDWKRLIVSVVGLALVASGLFIGGRLGLQMLQQQNADRSQDRAWQNFTKAVQGQDTSTVSVPGDAGNIYLKLTVPKLGKDGVAVDGDWNSLHDASMVHYHDSPAPGAKGNVLVAFHRETHWMDINQLKAGDQVQLQTRDLVVHTYQVDFVRTINPNDVSLLRPTDGTDLTMITCDPPWQDYNRMLFRAHLVQAG
jgi:sortase A